MNLCIDCRHREPGQWLTPLCKRPTDTQAELVCDQGTIQSLDRGLRSGREIFSADGATFMKPLSKQRRLTEEQWKAGWLFPVARPRRPGQIPKTPYMDAGALIHKQRVGDQCVA